MIGGALNWRPALWVTGGRGSGKSTLHRLISGIMGNALVSVSDATAAGIWQRLGYDSLPVIVDELEPGENLASQSGIIRFARLAASGGELARGSADHRAVRFIARACFLFSSILVPPLTPADRSRIVILNLGELGNSKPPGMHEQELAELGTMLLRRLVDQWGRYPDLLERYRSALMSEGSSAREADVMGTLLAISGVLLTDDEVNEHAARTEAMQLLSTRDHSDDGGKDEEQCLSHLRTAAIPLTGQPRRTVDQWISEAFELSGPESHLAIDTLAGVGLRVTYDKHDQGVLAIANSHDGLRRIFEATPWAGRPGASGGWVQAIRRLPGATKTEKDSKVKIGRGRFVQPVRVTLIPLALILNGDTMESQRPKDAACES
jgi:energy-coupling factor transporter ATP-binding protein EcfA2